MPWVTIQWYKGRDYETKKKVMKLVTDAICQGVGCKPEAVSVVFVDVDKRDWGSAGVPASER
ncbi:hypothetical protein A3K69_07670 [Candidatus Bathyarchaeota archaeon RBG_16_57_9]|jgi:4-oxalocrotonate tautomerase|nr:MAG: hypothetical protein A3K69_07670 [Candidatus Bathyarchaeota archaeon RBG_16_57_9]